MKKYFADGSFPASEYHQLPRQSGLWLARDKTDNCTDA